MVVCHSDKAGLVTGGVVLLAALVAVPLASAAPASMAPGFPGCVPASGNAVIEVALQPEAGWASVRAYFRAAGKKDRYFMEMRAVGQGRYMAVLPIPESETRAVDLHVEVRDAENAVTRSEARTVAVSSGCRLTLTEEQRRLARNLVAGETVESQRNKVIEGFVCEGVVSRIDVEGNIRPDEACRRLLIAKATNKAVLIPALAVGAGGAAVIVIEKEEKTETSPSR